MFVRDRLAEGWMLEQISGWLKSRNEPRLRACQEFRVRAGRTSSQAAIAFEKRSANMTAI